MSRANPEQHPAEATGHTAPEPRGLWQMTFGAVNSGAGRIFATILSDQQKVGKEHPPLPSDSKLFFGTEVF